MENNAKNYALNHKWVQGENFLQSAEWREFQEVAGHNTFFVEKGGFSASIIEHTLPIVGKYLYTPRGPLVGISNFQFPISNEFSNQNDQIKNGIQELVELAKKENAGWIRIEPENEKALEMIKNNITEKIVKAPHDTQPKEIFVLDISKPEEQLLAEMKSKTRYNINVAKKHGVKISACGKSDMSCLAVQGDFFRLTEEMAQRQGISTHAESYYGKMVESLPPDMLKIYSAQYEGRAIATNLVVFHEETAIYLHGASSNESRNVMAPFLLQWQAILDAKERGCTKYDFGGVKVKRSDLTPTLSFERRGSKGEVGSWEGITQFKLGFSPNTPPIVFPGTYDIIINPRKYGVYRGLQRAKAFAVRFRK